MDIGDRVRKGQLLAELWVPELVEDVHQKEATVIQDEALIVQAQEMLRAAEANYNWAGARLRLAEVSKLKAEADVIRWKAQYHRDGKLAEKEYVSREGLEVTPTSSSPRRPPRLRLSRPWRRASGPGREQCPVRQCRHGPAGG